MAVVACCLKIWTEAQKIAGQNFARADPWAIIVFLIKALYQIALGKLSL